MSLQSPVSDAQSGLEPHIRPLNQTTGCLNQTAGCLNQTNWIRQLAVWQKPWKPEIRQINQTILPDDQLSGRNVSDDKIRLIRISDVLGSLGANFGREFFFAGAWSPVKQGRQISELRNSLAIFFKFARPVKLERPCVSQEGASMLFRRRERRFSRREGGFSRRGEGFLRRRGGFLRRFV